MAGLEPLALPLRHFGEFRHVPRALGLCTLDVPAMAGPTGPQGCNDPSRRSPPDRSMVRCDD